jgi:acyl carrier protein
MFIQKREFKKMDKNNIQNQVIEIVRGISDVKNLRLYHTNSDLKKDLGLDSLDMFELEIGVEDRFSVEIRKKIGFYSTIGEIVDRVYSALQSPLSEKPKL